MTLISTGPAILEVSVVSNLLDNASKGTMEL